MTMTTRIQVLQPIDVHEFFRYGQSVLAQRDIKQRPVEEQIWSDEESFWNDGSWTIANQLGQDLPGIWDIDYRADGPLRAHDAGHNEDCDDEDCSGEYHDKACFAEASIDTAYGYRDEHGGCGDLHAWFLAQLIAWLDERGVGYRWYDESGGRWYDSAADLTQLCSSGASAQDWFESFVKPAIQQDIELRGGKVKW